MELIVLPIIAIIFIIYGTTAIISPSTIRNRFTKSHKTGLTDFGVNDETAEAWAKKHIPQNDWHYIFMGIMCVFFGSLLLYAVIKALFKF